MAEEKKATIMIPRDGDEDNAKKEQYKFFQRDGVTVQVPIGRYVEVPLWVAVRAKEIGLITDYLAK